MAKKHFILKHFSPGTAGNGQRRVNNLFNLSSVGLKTEQNLIKSSLSLGVTETNEDQGDGSYLNDLSDSFFSSAFAQYRDITKTNGEFVAFFNKSYPLRREYLRQFSQNGEINFVLDTIADEAIIQDENNYFAYLDMDRLKANINKNYLDADNLLNDADKAFKRVYSMFGWDQSNDAWEFFKKFLIDGVLAFEIIFDYDQNKEATNILAFKELDPITLEPDIVKDNFGNDVKIWFQYRGDQARERRIPDSNMIYISWAKGNFMEYSRISYLEGLTRSFNMLRQMENSRLMWNIQNSQKRIKITVPVGSMSPDRAKQRLSQLKAYYNEETVIDDFSGEITVNGMPKFSFTKTYMFPSVGGNTSNMEEMQVEGYDMNGTDQLKYFWRRFILETKIPANRFTLDPTSAPSNQMGGDATVTREEYAFSRFIQRIQSIYKEILLKPTWIQICLKHREIAKSNYFRTCIGLKYNQENLFTLAKERSIVADGASAINNLSGMQYADQTPVFSMRFLIQKYLGLTDEDIKLNETFKQGDELKKIRAEQAQQAGGQPQDENGDFGSLGGGGGFGGDMGGFGGGGGEDLGGFGAEAGGEMGGGGAAPAFGGAEAPGAEAPV